jgi:hypothetical protein
MYLAIGVWWGLLHVIFYFNKVMPYNILFLNLLHNIQYIVWKYIVYCSFLDWYYKKQILIDI